MHEFAKATYEDEEVYIRLIPSTWVTIRGRPWHGPMGSVELAAHPGARVEVGKDATLIVVPGPPDGWDEDQDFHRFMNWFPQSPPPVVQTAEGGEKIAWYAPWKYGRALIPIQAYFPLNEQTHFVVPYCATYTKPIGVPAKQIVKLATHPELPDGYYAHMQTSASVARAVAAVLGPDAGHLVYAGLIRGGVPLPFAGRMAEAANMLEHTFQAMSTLAPNVDASEYTFPQYKLGGRVGALDKADQTVL